MKRAFAIRRTKSALVCALVLGINFSEPMSATGFFVNQQSVRGLGRVDAGNTVAADELGTIFFNPAGLITVLEQPAPGKGIRLASATHLIMPRGDQRNRGSVAASPGSLGTFVPVGGGNGHNPTGLTPVPNLYAAIPLMERRAAFGFGVNAPFGLKASFRPDWHGRYDAIEAELETINYSFVGAYRFDFGLSVGGGLDVQYARTGLISAIPNPLTPGGPMAATDARIDTEGHAYTPGFNVGLLFDIDAETRVGVHYRSGMKHGIDGTSDISGLPGVLAAANGVVDVEADLHLPAITTIGLSYRLSPELELFGEFEWFDWSTFKEVRIRFADGRPDAVRTNSYRDAYAFAAGADYLVGPGLTARGGLHFDTTPTVDEFRDTTVPDAERLWLGLGGSIRASENVSFDFAFNHVFFRDTSIGLTRSFFEATPLATSVRIDSDVSTVVNTVSLDLRVTF